MAQGARISGVLQFSHFQVDLRAGELYKAGRRVKLQVQPFQILTMLLAHPGELITREELREKLWPADTFARVSKVSAATPSWTGQVARLCSNDNLEFVLLPIDEQALQERQKLDLANDDVGLSLLLASQRVLMVPAGTQVRVLEVQQEGLRCQVRILDGEHYGKTAVVPRWCRGKI